MAPRGQPLAADVVAKMKKLRAAGHTIPEVAAELSLSKSTVSRYMSRDDGGSENLRSTLAEWPTAERLVVSRSVLEGLLRDLTAARDASHLRPRPVDVGREEWT